MTLDEINGRSNNGRPHLGASSHRLSLRYSFSINVSFPLSTAGISAMRCKPVEVACDDIDRQDRELARLDSASSSLVMRSSGRAALEAALSRVGGNTTIVARVGLGFRVSWRRVWGRISSPAGRTASCVSRG